MTKKNDTIKNVKFNSATLHWLQQKESRSDLYQLPWRDAHSGRRLTGTSKVSPSGEKTQSPCCHGFSAVLCFSKGEATDHSPIWSMASARRDSSPRCSPSLSVTPTSPHRVFLWRPSRGTAVTCLRGGPCGWTLRHRE